MGKSGARPGVGGCATAGVAVDVGVGRGVETFRVTAGGGVGLQVLVAVGSGVFVAVGVGNVQILMGPSRASASASRKNTCITAAPTDAADLGQAFTNEHRVHHLAIAIDVAQHEARGIDVDDVLFQLHLVCLDELDVPLRGLPTEWLDGPANIPAPGVSTPM